MRKTIIKALITFCLFISFNLSAQNSYFEQYRALAQKYSQEFGIPTSIILSIAYIETGGGNSKLSKVYNNHFGLSGKNTIAKSKYRNFESAEASFLAFCESISRRKYYPLLKNNPNSSEWVNAIAKAGYSTHPTQWKAKIKHAITKFKLDESL